MKKTNQLSFRPGPIMLENIEYIQAHLVETAPGIEGPTQQDAIRFALGFTRRLLEEQEKTQQEAQR